MKDQELWKSMFSTDNRFMVVCEKIFDLFVLNLLFLISALPVFTLGIAKLSLLQTVDVIAKERRVPVVRLYFQHFKSQARLGLSLGLLEVSVYLICGSNLLLFARQTALPFQLIKVLCVGLLLFFTLIFLSAYPLFARRPLPLGMGLQWSLVLVSLNLAWFLFMMAAIWLLFNLAAISSILLVLTLLFLILIGFSLLAWGQGAIMDHILKKYPTL